MICPCCNREHLEIPPIARFNEDSGYFWECGCGTTMFFPVWRVEGFKSVKEWMEARK